MFFGSEFGLSGNFWIEQPKRNIHWLNRFDAVICSKIARQKQMTLVKFFQSVYGVLFSLFERNNVIGLQHSVKTFRNHRRIAAINAFGRHCVFIADQFRATTRTSKRLKGFCFVIWPFGAGIFRFPFSFLSFRRTSCSFLFIAEKFFNRADFKLRAAIFASDGLFSRQKT